MSTASTTALYDTIRARVLAFTDGTTTVASLVGARFYSQVPSDVATYQGISVVLHLDQAGAGWGNGRRLVLLPEFVVHGRGDATARQQVRAVGDLITGAMLEFNDVTPGETGILSQVRLESRIPLKAGGPDVDRKAVQDTLRFSALLWPHYLTKLTA